MVIGFLTILIQGIVLTYLYNFFSFTGSNLVKSMRYVLIVGLFFWTSHVLALVAKQNVENATQFILMESFYLAIQFGVFGICLAIIHKKKEKQLFNS
jgi:glucose uptake protein GlcU